MISAGIVSCSWNVVGFFLAAAPFVIFGYGWITSKWKSSDEMLRYFVNKQKETNKTSTIETPEPTSVEFQSWFCEIAAEALTENHRILLVVDNLDRVDPSDALKLWSAMRTFVDFSGIETPTWMPKLWVLAAFDENGIKHLWEKADNESLAATFLEKTFQIRFRIPAPLLSDWRKFLTTRLEKAFPKGTEDEFYKISRIYGVLKADKRAPTPRDMKVFVNQIGAAYRTSPPEDIPLPISRCIRCSLRQNRDPAKVLPEKEQLQPHIGLDLEKHLAALFFNMPSEQAVQVLLREQVEKAFTEGKPEILEHHASKNWLGDVIENIIAQRLPEWFERMNLT